MVRSEVTQKGNFLEAKLSITHHAPSSGGYPFATKTSPEFVISGVALFQMQLIAAQVNVYNNNGLSNVYNNNGLSNVYNNKGSTNVYYNNLLFVRFTKRRAADDLTYVIYFNSVELNIVGKTFTSDDGTWHLIHENKKQRFTFDVTVEMHLKPNASSLASLHGDTELTDFVLRGEGGSVRMHRAVMAAASPVLRHMLRGEWRDTAEGHVTGTSKATLEHLKTYLYLRVLPESGLEQLLILSSFYIMPELERLCVERLVRSVSAANVCDLIEFAAKNNLKRLLLAVLECMQNGAINVTEIRDHHVDESE